MDSAPEEKPLFRSDFSGPKPRVMADARGKRSQASGADIVDINFRLCGEKKF